MDSQATSHLDHFFQESVNLVLSVAIVTTINKMVVLLAPASCWGVQLEGPQEVGSLLEVGSACEDFVDQVLNANDVVFSCKLKERSLIQMVNKIDHYL